jgi:hypothetical protein
MCENTVEGIQAFLAVPQYSPNKLISKVVPTIYNSFRGRLSRFFDKFIFLNLQVIVKNRKVVFLLPTIG